MPPQEDFNELKKLIEDNNKLIEENNRMLNKLKRFALAGIIFRVAWYALLIGLPFALYFYLFEPYFAAFGSSFEVFKTGLNELPGLKGIDHLLNR